MKQIYYLKITTLLLFYNPFSFAESIATKEIKVIADIETGCQYVVSGGSIVDRLDTKGKTLCGKEINSRTKNASLSPIFIIDTASGCEYVRTYESNGLTVRLGSDGKPKCQSRNISKYPSFPID